MAKESAGLLMFRRRGKTLEVFLVHPGGPFWAKKDLALKIHDFRNTEGLAMVQIRYRGGFETKSEAFT